MEGSPPRVRGKESAAGSSGLSYWITPACAGKSFQWRVQASTECGSPPRVRGKGESGLVVSDETRITPACAGKRAALLRRRRGYRDHPRVCGEKTAVGHPRFTIQGSPPRVRGKESFAVPNRLRRRITPACAGKRTRFWLKLHSLQDHPRVCGEKKCFFPPT